jgi:hypothetical protein
MTDDKLMELALRVALGTSGLPAWAVAAGGGRPASAPSRTTRCVLRPALSPIDPRRSKVVLVLVRPGVTPRTGGHVAALEAALRDDGWDPEIQQGSPEPRALLRFLRASHRSGRLEGAFLIGMPRARRRWRASQAGLGARHLLFVDVDQGAA